MTKTFQNFIAGAWVAPSTGEYFENRNPADTTRPDRPLSALRRGGRRARGRVARSAASSVWRRTPAPARGDVLRRVGDLLVAAQGGDRRPDDARDGQAAHRDARRRAGRDRHRVLRGDEGRRLFGHTVPSELREQVGDELPPADRRVRASSRRSTSRWRSRRGRCFRRCVCGNACVFKPAEDVPHTGARARRDPARGRAAARGDPARARPRRGRRRGDRRASRRSGRSRSPARPRPGSIVGETCGRMHKRLSLEMGGKNAQIVMDDADLDLALDGVLWGAFGTTGQRCTATSRLILQTGIHDDFLELLVDRGAGAEARRRPEEGHRRRPAHPRGVAREGRALRRHRAGGGRRPRLRRTARRRRRGSSTASSSSRRSSRAWSRACGSSRRRSSVRCCR